MSEELLLGVCEALTRAVDFSQDIRWVGCFCQISFMGVRCEMGPCMCRFSTVASGPPVCMLDLMAMFARLFFLNIARDLSYPPP